MVGRYRQKLISERTDCVCCGALHEWKFKPPNLTYPVGIPIAFRRNHSATTRADPYLDGILAFGKRKPSTTSMPVARGELVFCPSRLAADFILIGRVILQKII